MTDTPKGVWVLTTEFNDYDQHGKYFCRAWNKKPTLEELAGVFGYNSVAAVTNVMDALQFVLHLENGGGRRHYEDQWYNLNFVEFGKELA